MRSGRRNPAITMRLATTARTTSNRDGFEYIELPTMQCTSRATWGARLVTAVLAVTSTLLWSSSSQVTGQPSRTDPTTTCIAKLSDQLKVGQLLLPIVATPNSAAAYATQGLLTGVAAIGVVDKSRATEYQKLLKLDSPIPLLLASDEEGGTVQRYRTLLGALPSARRLSKTKTAAEIEALFADYGEQLKNWGVTLALAPVADVAGGPGIGSRSFSDDADRVTAFSRAVAEGYLSSGVTPVYKHFPGHGRASVDTHKALALTPTLEEMRKSDLKPFVSLRELAGVAVMVGHLSVPGLTDGAPATVSRSAIDGLLRKELGFNGVVISDALGMGAIASYTTLETAAVRFVQAGGDILILPTLASTSQVHARLLSAMKKKEISAARLNESVRRVLEMKGVDPCSVVALKQRA